MKVRTSLVTGQGHLINSFISWAVKSIRCGARTGFIRRYVHALRHALIRTAPLHHAIDLQALLIISSGCGFDRLTLRVCGIWCAWARVDSTFRFMIFQLWKVTTDLQMPSVCFPRFSSSVVYPIIPLSWILLSLFSTSYMSAYTRAWCSILRVWRYPHDTFQTLLYWLNQDFGGCCQIGDNNTSTLIIYPMDEFAFVIGP